MQDSKALVPSGQRGVVAREEFGAQQTQALAETAATAVAAREQAAVQARYVMALRNPRDTESFRVALEKECQRPSFAAVAIYAKPVGKKWNPRTKQEEEQTVEGPSIRFIETALRCYRNIYPEVVTVFDSADIRICRVSVTDLESNLTYTTEVTISKTVERKGKQNKQTGEWEPPRGRELVGEGRPNSYGDMTYPVRATEDEVLIKQNALLSKAIRTNGQRLLPGDIIERCMKLIRETQARKDAEDPDAAKREILDAFAELDIAPIDLQAFVGHSLDRLQPAELRALRGAYSAVKNGEATWEDIMDGKVTTGSAEAQRQVLDGKLAAATAAKTEIKQAPPETKPTPTETQTTEPEPPAATTETKPAGQKPVFGRRS